MLVPRRFMSPPETVVSTMTVPATVPAFAAFVPSGIAPNTAAIASASSSANKNAMTGIAIAGEPKSLGDTVSRASEAAAMEALATLAPSALMTTKNVMDKPMTTVASAAPASNPFAQFPPFHPLATPQNPGAHQNGGPQWNAMLQYYAYYSYMLAHGGAPGMAGTAPSGAAPVSQSRASANGLPGLVPKAAPELWRARAGGGAAPFSWSGPGMMGPQAMHPAGYHSGMHPGMPGAGISPGMLPGMVPHMMTPAQMHSLAQMAAAGGGMVPPPLISVGSGSFRDGFGGALKSHKRGRHESRDALHGSESEGATKRSKRRGLGDEIKICVNCGCTRTPFWRKERLGVGSLCNACGLYLAKNDAPRPKMLWRRGPGSGESTPDATEATATPPPPLIEPSPSGGSTPPPPDNPEGILGDIGGGVLPTSAVVLTAPTVA